MPETPRAAFRRIRKASDLTLPELCRILGTPTISMITYVEQGKRRIPRAWLGRLPPEFAPVLQAVIREKLDELDELEKLLRRAATGRWPRTAPKPVPGSVAHQKSAVAQVYRLRRDMGPQGE